MRDGVYGGEQMSGEAMSYIHTARVLCSMFTAATFNNSRLKCERSITYRRARVNIKENRQNSDDIISDVRGPNRQTIKTDIDVRFDTGTGNYFQR